MKAVKSPARQRLAVTNGTATTTVSVVAGGPATTNSNAAPAADRHIAEDAHSTNCANTTTEANMAKESLKRTTGASEASVSFLDETSPAALAAGSASVAEPIEQTDAVSPLSGASPAADAAAPLGMPAPVHNDPFADLKKLRLSQDFIGEAGVKRVLSTVPVRKPHPQEFFRIRPEEEFRGTFGLVELKADNQFYLVTAAMTAELAGHYHLYVLYMCRNRQGVEFLWPVRLPDADGKNMDWWRTAHEAAAFAMTKWTNLKSNRGIGAYEYGPAPRPLSEPEWSEHSYENLLRAAFRDRLVDRPEHELVRQLQGLI
jgi:hypothetical protein